MSSQSDECAVIQRRVNRLLKRYDEYLAKWYAEYLAVSEALERK